MFSEDEVMGWDTRSHAWNDVKFFEDVKWVDPWEEAAKLHLNYVSPEYSWLDAATYMHTNAEMAVQRLDKVVRDYEDEMFKELAGSEDEKLANLTAPTNEDISILL